MNQRLLIAVTVPESLGLLKGFPRFLGGSGYDVAVVCSPGSRLFEFKDSEGIQIFPVLMHRSPMPLSDLRSVLRLIGVIREFRPSIIIASTPKAGFLLTLAGSICGVRRRIYLIRGLPLHTLKGLSRWVNMMIERLTCFLSTDVVCVSQSLLDEVVSLRIIKEGRGVIVGNGSSNGVDVAHFCPMPALLERARNFREEHGIPPDAQVVGFVGRLANDKGLETLAATWTILREMHPTARLVLAGEADARDPIQPGIEERLRADGRVHFVGHLRDPRPAFLVMDVFVFPSLREGFGNVLVEAAALKVPVVASDVVGCRDSVKAGVSGTLVTVGNAEAFATSVGAYLRNEELRRQIGQSGREWVIATFSRDIVWQKWYELLKAKEC